MSVPKEPICRRIREHEKTELKTPADGQTIDTVTVDGETVTPEKSGSRYVVTKNTKRNMRKT